MDKKTKALAILTAAVLKKMVRLSKLELLRLLNFDVDTFNSVIVNLILSQAANKLYEINREIVIHNAGKVIVNFSFDNINTMALKHVLQQRDALVNRNIRYYGKTLNQAAMNLLDLKKSEAYESFIKLTDKAFIGSKIFRRAADQPQKF